MDNLPIVIDGPIQEDTLRYVTFNVGNELFGVDIMCVESIIPPQTITPVPRTPDYFLGIINLRGEVISIVDMRILFGIKTKKITPETRIVVILSNGILLGMLVDQISAIQVLNAENIQPALGLATSDRQKFVSGSVKLASEKILLILLHDKLVDDKDFIIEKEIQFNREVVETAIEKKDEWSKEIPLVSFTIKNENYTIESAFVEEIIFFPDITTVPDMEGFLEGIFYLRDSVVPVIHLGERIGLGRTELTHDHQVIILKSDLFGIKIGLIVDDINEIFFIREDELGSAPINLNKEQSEHLKGVFKLSDARDNLIIMLLNLEKLFTFEEQDKLKKLDLMIKQEDVEESEQEQPVGILEFIIANERYAIKVSETNEIIRVLNAVPVPKAPQFIKGIINLRGDVISVIDLTLLVSRKAREITPQAKILIVSAGNETAGLLVERVLGIRKVFLSTFEEPSDLLRQKGNIFIEGIGKIDETDEIVVLMDIETTLMQSQSDDIDEEEDLRLVLQELEYLEMEDEQAELLISENT